MNDLVLILFYFFVYAFLGWIAEIVYSLATKKRLIDPGFLRLPLLPIYGVGAILIVSFIASYIDNPFLVFVLSVLVATLIEYVTHLVLDKVFHIQLWNYDDKPFNLQGRIALDMSIAFGVLALLLVYVIHPFVSQLVEILPPLLLVIIVVSLSTLVVLDATNTFSTLARIRLSKIKGTIEDIQEAVNAQLAKLTQSIPAKRRTHGLRKLLLRLHNRNIRRLQYAFPDARISTSRKKKS